MHLCCLHLVAGWQLLRHNLPLPEYRGKDPHAALAVWTQSCLTSIRFRTAGMWTSGYNGEEGQSNAAFYMFRSQWSSGGPLTGTESGGRLLSVTGAYLSQPSSAMRLSLSRSLQTHIANECDGSLLRCSNDLKHQQVLCNPHAVCAMQQGAAHRQHLLSFSSFSRSMSRLICSGSTSSSFFLQLTIALLEAQQAAAGQAQPSLQRIGLAALTQSCRQNVRSWRAVQSPVPCSYPGWQAHIRLCAGHMQPTVGPAGFNQPGHGGLGMMHLHASGRVTGACTASITLGQEGSLFGLIHHSWPGWLCCPGLCCCLFLLCLALVLAAAGRQHACGCRLQDEEMDAA